MNRSWDIQERVRNHPCLCVLPHYFGTSVLERLKNVTGHIIIEQGHVCVQGLHAYAKINSSLLVSHNGPSPKPPPPPSLSLAKSKETQLSAIFSEAC